MPFRFYLAGASKEIERCKRMRDALIAIGGQCTEDWMTAFENEPKSDSQLSHAERGYYARGDLRGVLQAELFLFLVPEGASLGAWVELGAALAAVELCGSSAARVICSRGDTCKDSIFLSLAAIEVVRPTIEEADVIALDAVKEIFS